mmetsp:Transcript_24331/g.69092  ORF Transcript_24331/g.69092 Transcript_24331/m.69092 type:complete len:243 (+) Transcript_24331:297-1025(+)
MASPPYAAEKAITTKVLHLPTICIAVAPSRCSTNIPTAFKHPAASTFASTPRCRSQPCSLPPLSSAAAGARSPAGSRVASTRSVAAMQGVCKTISCPGRNAGSRGLTSAFTSSSSFAPAFPRFDWMLRSSTTVLRDRSNIEHTEKPMPSQCLDVDAPEARMASPAAWRPPRRARQPPSMASNTASQPTRLCRAPKSQASTAVQAGVSWPSTALSPGSMIPSEALFSATDPEMVSTTGSTRRV